MGPRRAGRELRAPPSRPWIGRAPTSACAGQPATTRHPAFRFHSGTPTHYPLARIGRGPMLSSYSDVFAIEHDRDYPEEIHAGDLVRAGQNFFPHFEVLAVHGEKAWVRNIQSGADSFALLSR